MGQLHLTIALTFYTWFRHISLFIVSFGKFWERVLFNDPTWTYNSPSGKRAWLQVKNLVWVAVFYEIKTSAPALLGYYNRSTHRPTDWPTDQPTDRHTTGWSVGALGKASLPCIRWAKWLMHSYIPRGSGPIPQAPSCSTGSRPWY